MKFGSVCSGIEAASVAWHPLGWRAAWLAEIEPFPSAVLAHHYPEVPNLGDMTRLPERIRSGEVEAPDVFCGGTPCQAFSVAGLRKSLDDARGNLSLTFCEIANEIDSVRSVRGDHPCVVFWENVPGVLSTKDNAFGCFLAGLAGEDATIEPEPCPPAGRSSRYWKWNKVAGDHSLSWPVAGVVLGPARAVAWRVLDAQYFGVAQRRRRVFVVASARTDFDPVAVLFEFDGVRRDSAPSREEGETAAGGAAAGAGGSGIVGPLTAACGPNGHGGSGLATDKGAEAGHILAFGGNNTSGSIDQAAALNANRGCHNPGDFEAGTLLIQDTAHTLRGEGFDASEDGTGRGTPLVPVPFDTTQITSLANRSNPKPGDPCHPLAAQAHVPAIAFPANLSGTQHASAENLAPAMVAKNPTAVALFQERGRADGRSVEIGGDLAYALTAPNGGGRAQERNVLTAMQVRRTTPVECERLQGFPDGYTAISWRKKPASDCPDGPRYKALGNSWAVPVVAWIGRRIAAAISEPATKAVSATTQPLFLKVEFEHMKERA